MRGTQIMMVIVAAAALISAPLSGQRSAEGSALVVVPPVAELELQSASTTAARGTADGMISREGSLLVRVRANQRWRVLVEAPHGGATASFEDPAGVDVWWRATVVEEGAPGDYRPLPTGETAVAAEGGRGQVLIRIDYRWTGGTEVRHDAVPLMYTLATR